MPKSTVQLEVEDETANRFADFPESERLEIANIVIDAVSEEARRRYWASRLRETMDEAGRQAEDNGLTPEILAEILRD